jgi:hypothetical protein
LRSDCRFQVGDGAQRFEAIARHLGRMGSLLNSLDVSVTQTPQRSGCV